MDAQFRGIALTPFCVDCAAATLAVTLAQVADQLPLEFTAGMRVDGKVDTFVTHMKLGAVRPLMFQSGRDLLGRPAPFEHFAYNQEKLAVW